MLRSIEQTDTPSVIDFRRCDVAAKHGTQRWFDVRADPALITASRLGEATGRSKCGSAYAVYEERAQGKKRTFGDFSRQSMERGTRLEPAIIEHLRRQLAPHGWKVLGQAGLFIGAGEWKHHAATPDGFVVSPSGQVYVLEVKSRMHLDRLDAIPLQYAMQMLSQMGCTGSNGAFYFSVTNHGGWRLFFMRRSAALEQWARATVLPAAERFVAAACGNRSPPPKKQRGRGDAVKCAEEAFRESLTLVASDERPVFADIGAAVAVLSE